MPITILKNNVPWGPFTRAQIQEGLGRGDFTLQYLAHGPGLKEWLPLGEVLDYFDRGARLPPVPGAVHLPVVPRTDDLPAVPIALDQAKAPAVSAPAPVSTSAVPPLPIRPPALPAKRVEGFAPLPTPPPAVASPTPLDPPSPTPASTPARAETPSAAARPQPPPPTEMPKPVLRAAPFVPRFFAFAIDCMVLFVPILFLFALGALTVEVQGMVEHTDAETMRQEWALLWRNFEDLLLLVALGGAWLYAAPLECSRWQATVGKQWIGIKVTDRHGERLSFFRATGRHMAKCLSALPCFLGFTMAFFSSEGLSLHDRIARTRVIRK